MNQVFPSVAMIYTSNILVGVALAALLFVNRNTIRKLLNLTINKMAPDVMNPGSNYELVLSGLTAGIIVTSVLCFLGFSFWIGVTVGAPVTILLPAWLMKHRAKKYREAFDAVLAESLMTLSSSLRAGLTLKDAMLVAADNCPEPFSAEIGNALKEYHFGISIEEALENLRERVDTVDTKISFGAIIIGSQLGGKLPKILKSIVKTIRERERVEGRLKALTAQGRAQAFILCSAPPVLGVGMFFYDPIKMALLTDTIPGQFMLGLAIALEVIGIFVTMRVMRLDI